MGDDNTYLHWDPDPASRLRLFLGLRAALPALSFPLLRGAALHLSLAH